MKFYWRLRLPQRIYPVWRVLTQVPVYLYRLQKIPLGQVIARTLNFVRYLNLYATVQSFGMRLLLHTVHTLFTVKNMLFLEVYAFYMYCT